MPPSLSETSRDSSVEVFHNSVPLKNAKSSAKVTVLVDKAHAFVDPRNIAQIVCHREHEFLVQWSLPSHSSQQKAHSWVRLEEFKGPDSSLYHIQSYVERVYEKRQQSENGFLYPLANEKKRKLSPLENVENSVAYSSNLEVSSTMLMVTAKRDLAFDFRKDYNCRRIIKGNKIVIENDVDSMHDTELPTITMLQRAERTGLDWAETAIADEYNRMLAIFAPTKPRIRFKNRFDGGAPPLKVRLIDRYVYGVDVPPPNDETVEGCHDGCKPNMVNNCGCEYSRTCSCLEFAEVDNSGLRPSDEARFAAVEKDYSLSTMGLPKRFPYKIDGTMQAACLESTTRYALYECNDRCNCGPHCKTKVTQRGRKYGLEIFKTRNRGWGLRCMSNLRKGDFVDMYYGQVITCKEAGMRDNTEYLFDLDKFKDQLPDPEGMMLVVDGTNMGGVTRFINHSCEPNCAIFPISYNKNDVLRYNLAFFALDKIPKGEELTFDYQGQLADEYEYDADDFENAISGSQKMAKSRIRCNCGTPSCRGYLFL